MLKKFFKKKKNENLNDKKSSVELGDTSIVIKNNKHAHHKIFYIC